MKNLLISVSFSLCLYDVKKNPVHGTNVSGIPSGSDRGHHVAKLNLAVISHVLLVGFGTIIVIMSKLSLGFLINSKKSLMFLTISMHQNYHTFIFFQASSRKRFMDPSPSRKVWESDPLKAYALRLEQPGIQIAKKKEYL